MTDFDYMQRALTLAEQGRYTTSPNPMVGCVLVHGTQIVGEGFHQWAGQAHAEVLALQQAQTQAQGATCYVTLEPCSHFGRTPPCSKALINSGVARVVIAMVDPNPLVSGNGCEQLKQAGIKVEVGLCAEQAQQLNRSFIQKMTQQRPWIQAKLAASLDGRTALANGESQWISSEQSRQEVQQWRAQACCIVSTAQTVIRDQARLTVRDQRCAIDNHLRQPVRVIIDLQQRLTPDLILFETPSPIILVQSTMSEQPFPEHVEQWLMPELQDHQQIDQLFLRLGQQQHHRIWVEAGATFVGQLLSLALIDEFIVYLAPMVLGEQAQPLLQLPLFDKLAQAPKFHLQEVTTIDHDLRLIYSPNR